MYDAEDGASFTRDIETNVEKIIERLESIAQQKDVLGLREGLGKKPSLTLPSTSLVDESEIFGRDNDKKAILDLLLPNLQITNGIPPNQLPINENEVPVANETDESNKNGLLNNKNVPMTEEKEPAAGEKEVRRENRSEDLSVNPTSALTNKNTSETEDEILANKKKFATNRDQIPVVAIVGMPGVGKTTLAQLLFNDKRVNGTFLPSIWVHVSEVFDILKITRTIYESLTNAQSHTAADLNTLQVRLQARLKKEKFLLILDDTWNENFIDWDVLLKPFKAANPESRIVVTTRSSNVASAIRATHTYQLSCLSHEDCWSLFAKHAFHHRISYKGPAMKEIGEKIVKKCNGLPLAAKTLGALLPILNVALLIALYSLRASNLKRST